MDVDYRVGQSVRCGACGRDGVLTAVVGAGAPVGPGVEAMTVEHPTTEHMAQPTTCDLTGAAVRDTVPL